MKTEWKGRSALHLGNDRVEMTVLTGGGHIASFSFTPASGHATDNVIWESPWTTADPLTPEHDELSEAIWRQADREFSRVVLRPFAVPRLLRTSIGFGGQSRSHAAWRGRNCRIGFAESDEPTRRADWRCVRSCRSRVCRRCGKFRSRRANPWCACRNRFATFAILREKFSGNNMRP